MGQVERLQKVIAAAGVASRRKAEQLIEEGRVSVNGQVVTALGTRADPSRDHIKVDGKLLHQSARKTYILLNKPRQVISSVSDPQGRTKVTDLVNVKGRLYPVGRLDYNTEGLIVLTNDGDFSRILAAAGNYLPKVYEVKVRSTPTETQLNRLRVGIRLPDRTRLAPCRVAPVKLGANSWYRVSLTQGRNRQVRKMFEAIGHPVVRLRRIRIGFLTDQGLSVGQYRFLTSREVDRVLRLGRVR